MLAGDLYLKGSGDPKLTLEQFWLLLRQLRARGVREIRGDLVLDRSAFAAMAHDEAAFDGKPTRPYNVGPDALLLNFKALRLTLLPDEKRVLVMSEPAPANLDIINLLKTNGGACGQGSEWREALRADLSRHNGGGNFRLVLTGNYPAACGEQRWNIGLLPHPRLCARRVPAAVDGTGRRLHRHRARRSQCRPTAQRLASVESPALAEIVRDINKFSNNVMARQVFLTLARKGGDGAAARCCGRHARRCDDAGLARSRGLRFPELVLDNGSGLSRRERISADSMARLLAAAWKSAVMPELIASLPLTAVDGTMKKRLRDGGTAGQAHIKTGSLEGVKTMAGYVLDNGGRRQVVVFFVNHANASAAQAAQDALLQWVHDRGI